TQTRYDALGRTIQVSNPYRPGEDIVWTTTQYDGLGRVFTVTTPDGAQVTTTYRGSEVTVTDQAGKQRSLVTDALGRLRTVYEPHEAGALTLKTTYQYDARGNLINVLQGQQTRTFAYDALGRLTSSTAPESSTTLYAYDPTSNLLSHTDARDVVIRYDHDAL